VSGILDSSAGRKSGEVVAENWNSVPLGRWSLLDHRACEMSASRLNNVVCYSQQVSRVNAAMRGPSKERSRRKAGGEFADRKGDGYRFTAVVARSVFASAAVHG